MLRRGTPNEVATQGSVNTRLGVERCVRYAFELAAGRERQHLTLVHKTNVLTFSGDLWQRTFNEVAAEYPDVATAYNHVDAACIYFVQDPQRYDVVVTDNLFGDILTDLGGAVSGGIGLASSANLNPAGTGPSMFEPVHGSAPDIVGTGKANPIAAVLSAAMMLDFLGESRRRRAGPRRLRGAPGYRYHPRDRCTDRRPSGRLRDPTKPREPGGSLTDGVPRMPIQPTSKIWMNGNLVDWDQAKIHVLTHTLHYGTGVFEGIRAYETSQGPAVFRLTEHIERLHDSAKILGMEIPYSVEELVDATKATVASTGLPSCYIRPIAYYGYGEMGLNTLPCTVDVAIACWPWGAYLGPDAVEKGVRMKISSWTRHDHNTMPPAAKTVGNYVNSSLAKVEALKAGYDEAIMLAPNGLVAECTGENIFCVRNGIILTPPISAGALEGITQSSVHAIARDLGFEVRVDNIARSDLYIADELFVCGTAAEISSVNSVDDRSIPCPGPMTKAIADVYARAVRGEEGKYKDWCELV